MSNEMVQFAEWAENTATYTTVYCGATDNKIVKLGLIPSPTHIVTDAVKKCEFVSVQLIDNGQNSKRKNTMYFKM